MESIKQSKTKEEAGYQADFSFSQALEEVISALPERSREIIKSRFGINGAGPKTLEEVGNAYKITRERVRQIIKEALKKIRQKANSEVIEKVKQKIEFTIGQNSGIIREKEILDRLGKSIAKEQNAVSFFLNSLEGIEFVEEKREQERTFALSGFDFSKWKEIKDVVRNILDREKRVLTAEELFEKFSGKVKNVDQIKLFHWLSVSKEIKRNNFGKWGLDSWGEINPRVTMQRAYLILKETRKPLHFREIAELIDKHKLGKGKTHPQTVHNELIKNSHFVLVGRGTYALAEWGYKEGTVKEVLEDILRRSGKPMKRNEILDKILKMRQVKKSTVLINLNNFFVKAGKDAYTVKIPNFERK